MREFLLQIPVHPTNLEDKLFILVDHQKEKQSIKLTYLPQNESMAHNVMSSLYTIAYYHLSCMTGIQQTDLDGLYKFFTEAAYQHALTCTFDPVTGMVTSEADLYMNTLLGLDQAEMNESSLMSSDNKNPATQSHTAAEMNHLDTSFLVICPDNMVINSSLNLSAIESHKPKEVIVFQAKSSLQHDPQSGDTTETEFEEPGVWQPRQEPPEAQPSNRTHGRSNLMPAKPPQTTGMFLHPGKRWLTAIIRKLWDTAWDLWDQRNHHLHKVDTTARDSLLPQDIALRWIFNKVFTDFCAPLATLLAEHSSPTPERLDWLRSNDKQPGND
jgi:hypothetical protein